MCSFINRPIKGLQLQYFWLIIAKLATYGIEKENIKRINSYLEGQPITTFHELVKMHENYQVFIFMS